MKGNPFRARYERVEASNAGEIAKTVSITTGKIYRNSVGSTRIDKTMGELSIAQITDVTKDTLIIKDLVHNVILSSHSSKSFFDPSLTTEQSSEERGSWRLHRQDQYYTSKYRLINGVNCREIKFRSENGEPRLGVWWAEDLEITMLDITECQGNRIVYRLIDLVRGDPDPGLFE